MSDDKDKNVKIEGMDKVDKDGKKDEGDDDDLDAIFGEDTDSVRLSKTKLEVSKSQLEAVIQDDDDDLEDDDD